MNYPHPLISCICITANRPIILQRAIACFVRQDYPNTELVISYPENDFLTKAVIDQIAGTSIMKMVRIEHPDRENPVLTKNNAINAANGAFICIWDDEHWHHVNRISDQYRVIKGGPFRASLLMHVLLFNFKDQQTYYSDYLDWQETLLCEKNILLQASYMDIERADDAPLLHFLSSRNILYHITEAPHLYIYIYYENKHSDGPRFNAYFSQSEVLEDINQVVQEVINMDYYLPDRL